MSSVSLFLFALLFVAHTIGDFVLQTESIVKGKQSSLRILGWHVLQHVMATMVVLVFGMSRLHFAAPEAFPSWTELGLGVGTIAVVHLVVDKVKILAVARFGRSTLFYVADQGIHVATLFVVVRWWESQHPEWAFLSVGPIFLLGQSHAIEAFTRSVLIVGALILATRGGAILSWLLTLGLRHDAGEDAWQAASLPAQPLKDNTWLWQGYVVRALLLLACVSWPWWLALGLIVAYGAFRFAATRESDPLWRRFQRADLTASLAAVLVLAGLVRGLT